MSFLNPYDMAWKKLFPEYCYPLTYAPMGKETIAVGIDVAKATVSICFHHRDGSEKVLSIRNSNTDMQKKLLPRLKHFTGRIVMESTGHYHWTTALILAEEGHRVYVVNPLLAKQYVSTNIRKIKSDPADASALARMARVADNLPAPFSASKQSLWLRKKLGLIASTSKQVQALAASLKSVREAQELVVGDDSPVITDMEKTLAALKKHVKELETECVQAMQKEQCAAQRMALLTSIPGISAFCATLCLHWFNRAKGTDAASWIAYAGLDVSVRESGTWHGVCRLTKRGNAFLRKRLYACAWGAWQNDENFHHYYTQLRQRGKQHNEALVIIARKLVRIAFNVLKHETPYDARKCFV